MKILHTSDWHLGQNFMGKSRKEEHEAFFSWLLEQIEVKKIDVLIVAGDIFDTGTPPNYALRLYYDFLKELSTFTTLTTVIIAGNHDSIPTLNAPKQLLEVLHIHLVTSGDTDENQIVPIYKNSELQAVICAVPFLRDGIVRSSVSGKGLKDKEKLLNIGIKEHYLKVYEEAKAFSKGKTIPIIATGHLMTLGSRSSESERDIYIGGTLDIGSDFLGKYFDYVALGHLHLNQKVGVNHVRYSGSPISLSFSESNSIKKINFVSFENKKVEVEELTIPLSQPLLLLKGDLQYVTEKLEQLKAKETWIEVQLNDDNPRYANQVIRELATKLGLILLAVKIDKKEKQLQAKEMKLLSLDELGASEVFDRRIELEGLESDEFKKELLLTFKKVVDKVESR